MYSITYPSKKDNAQIVLYRSRTPQRPFVCLIYLFIFEKRFLIFQPDLLFELPSLEKPPVLSPYSSFLFAPPAS